MSAPDEPAPRRGRPRDARIRENVLAVTAQLFRQRGYDALTMEGIVAETGIAKRTLYRWWPTKSAVVADAILSGVIEVPRNPLPHTDDLWADLDTWLTTASASIRGPYGDVLRAATAIAATDPVLGAELALAFGRPAQTDLGTRLAEGVRDGQVSPGADVDATIDLIMSVIAYTGATRDDATRLPAVLTVIRRGISPEDGEGGQR